MADMTEAALAIKRNLPPQGFPVRRFLYGVFMTLVFIVISSTALISALGYKVNWAAGSIQRTGLLEINTKYDVAASVYINGVLQDEGVPFRKAWLLPGTYTVKVTANGYNSWEETVQIHANERVSFPALILVYSNPPPANVPVLQQSDLFPQPGDQDGIEIKSGNELWANGTFLTRTSQDILNEEWFPGRQQIVYQVGNTIVLYDISSGVTQNLAVLTTSNPALFTLRENGRILIYQDGPIVKAVQLFAQDRLIDRLAIDH